MSPSNPSTYPIDSPYGWLDVAGGFIASFIAFGVSYAFGVFLKPMASSFGASHASMSLLFASMTVLSYVLAPLSGRLADRRGPRLVLAVGAVLMAAGLFFSARVTWFPLLFLTYGIGVGAAVACAYVPAVAAVSEWFKKERDLALGVAISGTGFGTLVGAPAAAHLISRLGWRGAFDVFAAVSLAALLLCSALLARPPVARQTAGVDVWEMMRTRAFVLLYLGLAFRGVALYITVVFLPVFASDIGASHVAAAALIAYLGVASIVGRVGLAPLAPRLGLMNTYLLSCAIFLFACVIWVLSHSYVPLVMFAIFMGVGYGANAAMTPSVAAVKFGTEGLGALLGWLYTSFAVGAIAGPPLAGTLADITHDYRLPVVIALIGSAAATGVVLPLRTSLPHRARAAEAGASQ